MQNLNSKTTETWYGYPEGAQVFSADCPTILPEALANGEANWQTVGGSNYLPEVTIYEAKVANYLYTIHAYNSIAGPTYTVYRENLNQFSG